MRYLPPERTGFVKVAGNAQSDLYSLGVSLYEFASGIELFNASTAKEIVTLILSHIPQHLSSIIKDFPEQISDIIDKLIRKNPADRYQTAAGISADLKICQIELAKNEIPAFFALGKKDTFRELNYKIPMVGRQNKLQYLTRLLKDAQNKKGNSVFIGAPSGTGKSRLASEFSNKAQALGFQIFSAKFSEYERNVPLGAIGWAAQEYATWLRQQSTELKEKWKTKIAKALNLNGAIIAKRFSYLQNLLPVFPPLNKISKDDETQLFYNSMAVLLTHLNINGRGNIIYLDDLQWADSESLKIVKELQNFESENNMQDTLFVGTYRNDEVLANHPLEINILRNIRSNQKIILAPLSVTESNQLVHDLIDESSPEVTQLAKTTFQLTQGNPFFTY